MIAVISDVHFPSNAERQKIMETGLKKLTGIRALFTKLPQNVLYS